MENRSPILDTSAILPDDVKALFLAKHEELFAKVLSTPLTDCITDDSTALVSDFGRNSNILQADASARAIRTELVESIQLTDADLAGY